MPIFSYMSKNFKMYQKLKKIFTTDIMSQQDIVENSLKTKNKLIYCEIKNKNKNLFEIYLRLEKNDPKC